MGGGGFYDPGAMPELPEVEVLVRHLAPCLQGRTVVGVRVLRARAIRPSSVAAFVREVEGACIRRVGRRAKYLVFDLEVSGGERRLLGHLGMTGRMYLREPGRALAKHAAVVFDLGSALWVFEDSRGFGRMTTEETVLEGLGPEPLSEDFGVERLGRSVRGSRQAIKVKLLDQRCVAGLGNIYASEALHRAGISPRRRAGGLKAEELERLRAAVVEVLEESIRLGSSVPLDFSGEGGGGGDGDGLFYYGRAARDAGAVVERFRVYDRAGEPCWVCGAAVRRLVQGGRSTYYCSRCQR